VDWLLDKVGMGYSERLPTAWEYVLRKNWTSAPYVRLYLKEQPLPVGGVLGSSSFASTEGKREDLYLQELLPLDELGRFTAQRYDNWGAWFSHDSISRVEFFEGADTPRSTKGEQDDRIKKR
jgi:hypothetical protein